MASGFANSKTGIPDKGNQLLENLRPLFFSAFHFMPKECNPKSQDYIYKHLNNPFFCLSTHGRTVYFKYSNKPVIPGRQLYFTLSVGLVFSSFVLGYGCFSTAGYTTLIYLLLAIYIVKCRLHIHL